MRMRYAAVAAGLALTLMSSAAKAAYIIDIKQVGNDVLVSGSGSLNLSGLSLSANGGRYNDLQPARNHIYVGPYGREDVYTGNIVFSGYIYSGPQVPPFDFGPDFVPDSTSGPTVGFVNSPLLDQANNIDVPEGYVSGSPLGLSTQLYLDKTISGLYLNTGRYTDTWSSDQITINIEVSAVPLPASAPMFSAALLGLAGLGYVVNRKKTAAPA